MTSPLSEERSTTELHAKDYVAPRAGFEPALLARQARVLGH